jgi:hypothetical protein
MTDRLVSWTAGGVLAGLLSLPGCVFVVPVENDALRRGPEDRALILDFFPERIGTTWIYEGTAEHHHTQTLRSVSRLHRPEGIRLMVAGEVRDASDGESKADFRFEMEYESTSDEVYENLRRSDTPFPHMLRRLLILKRPLRPGASWTQTVRIDSKEETLIAEVIGAREPALRQKGSVTVRYRAPMAGMPGGCYEEIREFEEGRGIVRFERTMGPGPAARIMYSLRDRKKP